MSWKQRLDLAAFALGVGALIAATAGGFAYALRSEGSLPDLDLGFAARANELLARGETAEALDVLDVAAHIQFGDPASLRNLLKVAEANGDRPRQEWALSRLVWLHPSDANLRARWIEVLALDLDPSRARTPDYAQRLELIERQAAALVELEPQAARGHHYLGMVALSKNARSGDPRDAAQAARHLRRALELQPDLEEAKRALDFASARSGS